MRILIDTRIALWALTDDERLPTLAREFLGGSRSDVYFSVASLWEIAIKASIGKLDFSPGTVGSELRNNGFQCLPIKEAHLDRLVSLLHHHRDPFDRMLVAQAEAEPLKLVTVDGTIRAYGPAVLVL